MLTETPTLSVDVVPVEGLPAGVELDQNVFQCSIETPDIDEDILFDVTFFIAGKQVYQVTDLPEDQLPAELPESEFHTFQDEDHHPNLGYGNNVSVYSTLHILLCYLIIMNIFPFHICHIDKE